MPSNRRRAETSKCPLKKKTGKADVLWAWKGQEFKRALQAGGMGGKLTLRMHQGDGKKSSPHGSLQQKKGKGRVRKKF